VDGMDEQVQIGRLASAPGVDALMPIFEKNGVAQYWMIRPRLRPPQVSSAKGDL
jgi:hypothetical protein